MSDFREPMEDGEDEAQVKYIPSEGALERLLAKDALFRERIEKRLDMMTGEPISPKPIGNHYQHRILPGQKLKSQVEDSSPTTSPEEP